MRERQPAFERLQGQQRSQGDPFFSYSKKLKEHSEKRLKLDFLNHEFRAHGGRGQESEESVVEGAEQGVFRSLGGSEPGS